MNNLKDTTAALAGLDSFFDAPANITTSLDVDVIDVREQVRTVFDSEDQTIEELAESIAAQGQIQPVVVRQVGERYELVAGERRLRACRLKGLQVLARVVELSDEQAQAWQFAENVHRLNLTQLEEARRLKADVDAAGGDVEAVAAQHSKSRSWVYKLIGLLNLPEQAQRLIDEGISADTEVIGDVRAVENVDPAAAQELVEELKAGRGKSNARATAKARKNQVKPPKAGKKAGKDTGGSVATPKDRSHEEPGPVSLARETGYVEGGESDFAPFETGNSGGADALDPFLESPEPSNGVSLARETEPREDATPAFALSPLVLLDSIYIDIFEGGAPPATALRMLTPEQLSGVEDWLRSFYDAGPQAKDPGKAVMSGLRNGEFATDGAKSFALVAFINGCAGDVPFSVLDCFGAVK